MRRLHHHAVTGGLLVARDQPVLMEELVVPETFVHADGLADVGDRHRVARRAHRHQGIVGDPALSAPARNDTAAGFRAASVVRGQSDRSAVRGWSRECRRSATSTLQRSSQSLRSSHEVKRRPASALRLTYLTPLSTLPLVRAR